MDRNSQDELVLEGFRYFHARYFQSEPQIPILREVYFDRCYEVGGRRMLSFRLSPNSHVSCEMANQLIFYASHLDDEPPFLDYTYVWAIDGHDLEYLSSRYIPVGIGEVDMNEQPVLRAVVIDGLVGFVRNPELDELKTLQFQ